MERHELTDPTYQQFVLKEMDVIQRVLDKHDDWLVKARAGMLAAVGALIYWSLDKSAPVVAALTQLELILVGVSYLGEALIRWDHWSGYVNRRHEIETFLNSSGGRLRLYDPKGKHSIPSSRWDRICMCWFKRETALFHFAVFLLVILVAYLLHPGTLGGMYRLIDAIAAIGVALAGFCWGLESARHQR